MPYYRSLGLIPPKRHTLHRVSPGYKNEGIYYEEVVTTRRALAGRTASRIISSRRRG